VISPNAASLSSSSTQKTSIGLFREAGEVDEMITYLVDVSYLFSLQFSSHPIPPRQSNEKLQPLEMVLSSLRTTMMKAYLIEMMTKRGQHLKRYRLVLLKVPKTFREILSCSNFLRASNVYGK
jgi:hypothetical protein